MVLRRRSGSELGQQVHWPRQWHLRSAAPVLVSVFAACLAWRPLYLEPLLAVAPALAGIGAARARQPLSYGAAGLLGVGLLAARTSGTPLPLHVATAIAVAAVTAVSAVGAVLSSRRDRRLARVITVAEVAQRALLRPPPDQVGPLDVKVLYLAAAAEAQVGGDLYEVTRTKYGVRLIMGDVRGKGLGAVEVAADVLGVFREAAHDVYTLGEVARRLDASLTRRNVGHEEFVTAVLAEIDPAGRGVTIYNCGHPPPILLSPARGGDRQRPRVTIADVPIPAPPLGLMALGDCSGAGRELPLQPGDFLLLYTDGVTEARDAQRRFYPLAERLPDLASVAADASRPGLLELVRNDLLRHTGKLPDDDVALLLLRVAGAPAMAVDAQPSITALAASAASAAPAAAPAAAATAPAAATAAGAKPAVEPA